MPISRSPPPRGQAAAERTLRVYEDYPASPSAEASHSEITRASARTATARTRVAATATATAPHVTAMETDAPASDVAPPRTDPAPTRRSRAPSVRSRGSASSITARIRRAELEAEEQLAVIKRQELQIQAQLITKKLAADVAAIQEETDQESVVGAEETEHRVTDWLQHTGGEPLAPEQPDADMDTRYRYRHVTPTNQPKQRARSPTPQRNREKGIDRLAEAIEKMVRNRPPPRQTQDLPIFSGAIGEWLPFKAAMRESTVLHKFTPAENIARLRSCLRGEARQTVSALLFTATDPVIIMRTLEQCYGRPEMIIDNALEEIKKLPRLGTTASELNAFAIKLQNIVTVISSMDERGYLQNPMLARLVTEKLGPHVKSRWCDFAEDFGNRNEPELVTLSRFLMREADRAMRHAYSTTVKNATNTRPAAEQQPRVNERSRKPVYATTESETSKNEEPKADTAKSGIPKKKTDCFCCGEAHETIKCPKFTAMPIEKRWDWAREAQVCFKCLASKHRRYFCKNKLCGVNECRRQHHALLHTDEEAEVKSTQDEETATTASAHVSSEKRQILLKICPVTIKSDKGNEISTYALLDEGSTITLIDGAIADKIGARGPKRALNIIGATSSQRESNSRIVDIQIKGRGQSNFEQIRARTVKNLTLGQQSVGSELLQQAHLRSLRPEDVCYPQAKPQILIGADNWHLIVARKLLAGKKNQPAASLCHLGWVVHGSAPRGVNITKESVFHVHSEAEREVCERDGELNELVKAHFEIDALGVSLKRKPIAKEERAKEIFNRTARRVDGRFEVGLPWANDHITLPPSYDMAFQRLRGIERKMDKSPEFKAAYTAQVKGLFDKGYAVKCEEDQWPKEEKSEPDLEVITAHVTERLPLIDVTRFSSYERLVRAAAYVLLFIDKCRRRAKELEIRHIEEAERLLIQQAQRESFPDDLARLKRKMNIDRSSRLYKLDPKYGDDNLIRLNGRINAATVPDSMKNPPILDGSHPLTRLIIHKEHIKGKHAGREQIVNTLRQQYWILRLRPATRTILHECTICKMKRASPAVPVKGDLPQSRLNTHTRPFTHCGIDCFGPMWVTIGRRKEKRWGMLFTCLVVRAIHVELLASLTTDSAIMAIRRMAARRGMPALIISDNATNFHGSDLELDKAYKEWLPALRDFALSKRVEWRFIDPGAPNQGGAWERMIKSVKNALAVTLTEQAPKEEVLVTLMAEIEHTVNSRPLTHVPVDPEDTEALTPNHFLLGTTSGLPYVGQCDTTDKRTWRATQALANIFWSRWIKEYLPTLTPRNDARKRQENVKPGDLVIIADGLLPRNVWPRGIVERVHTGPDGVVRSAEVRTRGGIFRRPVRRLVVLPIEKGCEDLRRGEDVADDLQ